ncbi:MAG: RNA polymerase sigma factor [Mangrovibacterium sp.]
MEYTNDLTIWENIRKGDLNSLRVLHDRYFIQLCVWTQKVIPDQFLSEELVSDCFVKLWLGREHILIQKSVKGYLFFMLKNQIIDHSRKSHLHTLDLDSLPDLPDNETFNRQDFYAELYEAIQKLPRQRRKILQMAAFDSLTYKEIAAQLDISVSTVKTQMVRAYQFLKKELDPKSFILFSLFHPCC